MDHSQSKLSEYFGKTCPYCKTEFKEEDEIVVCSACEMPHHKDCWIENQGCTTFGCQGTIRGVDGQAYGQMMAEGARQAAAPHFTPSGAEYAAGSTQANPYRANYAAGGQPPVNSYQASGSTGTSAPVNPYLANMAAGSGAPVNPYRVNYSAGGQPPIHPYRAGYAPTAASGAANPYRATGAATGPFCSRCGTRNAVDAKFCFECGAELFLAPAPKNVPPPKPGIDASRPYDAIPKQGAASVSRPYDAIPKQGAASASRPYDAIPKQGSASASRPYDAVPKQGAARAQSANPYRPASQSAPANPYHAPQPTAAPAQSVNSYRPASQSAPANPYRAAPPPPSYQPPVYPPPGAGYAGAYRQASYPPPGGADLPPTPEELAEEQKLFLQENEAYYQKKFAVIKSGQIAWNWSACLLGPYWMLYRRMYAWAYPTLFVQYILLGVMGYAWPVVPLLCGILFGLFGTRLYMSQVEQGMNRVRRLSAVNRRIEYADKGGVRIGQALAMAAVSALFFASILSAIYY